LDKRRGFRDAVDSLYGGVFLIMFKLYENGTLVCECSTYDDAVFQAAEILNQWAPSLSYLRVALANEVEWDYSGYGDTIQIKEG